MPALPEIVTPASLKPLTGLLNTAVKLIGEALVGSAWPAAWLIVTVGGLATVTVTGSDVHRAPSTSLATAVRVCEPLLAVVVFQETEYGAEVSSAPRLLPSSLNWTPWTVREPTPLTLAVTATVPLTVDPGAGDVRVTIRLPDCARTGCGAIQLQTIIADRAARRAILLIMFIP